MKKIIFVFVCGLLLAGCGSLETKYDSSSMEKYEDKPVKPTYEYSNSYYPDYVISYPEYMKVSEVGQNNRRAIISTQDYKIDMSSGKITFGFKVDIFVSYFDSMKLHALTDVVSRLRRSFATVQAPLVQNLLRPAFEHIS